MYFKNPRLSENLTIFIWLFQGILVILQLTPVRMAASDSGY